MKRTVCFVLFLVALLALGASATAQTTQPGLFFTIVNNCSTPVSGFAVGDQICLLQVGTASFTRAIFNGTMAPGQKQFAMACTKNALGSVIFVPSVSMPIQAVTVAVKPNATVPIPNTFCGKSAPAPETLFKKPGK
jgi:hypothetical protein